MTTYFLRRYLRVPPVFSGLLVVPQEKNRDSLERIGIKWFRTDIYQYIYQFLFFHKKFKKTSKMPENNLVFRHFCGGGGGS